jgi:hypothetical protein
MTGIEGKCPPIKPELGGFRGERSGLLLVLSLRLRAFFGHLGIKQIKLMGFQFLT